MTTLANRIEETRKLRGLSKTDIWKAAGLSSGAYTHWMNGSELKGENLIKVAKILRVNPSWLENGKGQMEENAQVQELPGYTAITHTLSKVPVVGKGMGGLPDRMFTDEGRPTNGHDDYADVYSSDIAAFATRVDGNSMYPKYVQGDYALVEPSVDPELEDDVLIKIKTGEVMLKRLISRRGGIHLASYNDSQTYIYQPEDIIWMYYVAYPIPARKIKSRI